MAVLNFNKVILAGHITNDIEQKQTPSGVTTTTFNIAVNRRYEKDGQREADFLTIVAWRQTAEFVCRYFKKGSAICVVGSIQTRKWKDNAGNNRYTTEIVADEVYFVERLCNMQNDTDQGNQYSQLSAKHAQETPQFESIKSDDELPF